MSPDQGPAPFFGRKLADLAKLFNVHPSSVTRWITGGLALRDGTRLKLRAARHPGHWVVTDEAIESFLATLTRDRLREPTPHTPSIPAARRPARGDVDRELERAGI
jgi:hypothetical protein